MNGAGFADVRGQTLKPKVVYAPLLAKFNETFVMMEYFGYLRRDADAVGYSFWLNKRANLMETLSEPKWSRHSS